MDIELKDYGHNDRLEGRVVELVEAAGMEKQIVTMSLSRDMVATMAMRPGWTSPARRRPSATSSVPADFAVEKAMATRRFLRAAHHAGSLPCLDRGRSARMIRMIGLGVDGIITNRPAARPGTRGSAIYRLFVRLTRSGPKRTSPRRATSCVPRGTGWYDDASPPR